MKKTIKLMLSDDGENVEIRMEGNEMRSRRTSQISELNLEEDQLRRIFTNRIVKVEGDQAEVLFEKIWPGDVPTGIEFSVESPEKRRGSSGL